MYKYLLISLLLVSLSACTMPWTKKDESFVWLYKANIVATLDGIDKFWELIGINRHESIEGNILSSMNIPGILSGSLSSDYSWLIDGRNSESFFRNIKFLYTSLVSSGAVSADELAVAAYGADSYVSYKNIVDGGMIPDDTKTILKKYEWAWLNISGYLDNSGSMTSAENFGYNIGRNLMSKSLSDIEKYATTYPIWRDTADLGMSGSLHYWSVELDRPQIVSLIKQLSLDLAGTGMIDTDVQTLESNLATMAFSGKIWFDPQDPRLSVLDGVLSASGKTIANLSIIRGDEGGSVRIDSPENKAMVSMNYGKKDKKYTLDMTLRQNDVEMGKITAYVERDGSRFRELSIEGSAQGITVSLRHTLDGDKFTGKLSAVVGTLEWSGTITGNELKSLKINGTSPVGSLSVDLTESGSMVRWPILVVAQWETLFSAELALAMERSRFAMIIDVISDSFPAHFDLDIRAKSTPSTQSLTAPKNTKYFQDLLKEIEALNPVPTFSDESQSDLPAWFSDPSDSPELQ